MKLKNTFSESSLPNIFADIEKTLMSHNAKQVVRDYEDGKVMAISFAIDVNGQRILIRLPAKVDQVQRIFDQEGIRYNKDQPYRTAWATIRDWVSAQMALIDWQVVKMEEVFLPYMVWKDNKTTIELMQQSNFLLKGKNE